MRNIKKFSIILSLCLLAAFASGCDSSGQGDEESTPEESSFESEAEERTEQTEQTTVTADLTGDISTTEISVQKERVINFIYEDADFEITKNMDFAKTFLENLTKSWFLGDSSILDVDKYIDNKYLNRFVKDNLDYVIKNMSYSTKWECTVKAKLAPATVIGNIEYYYINYTAYDKYWREYGLIGGGMIGIRDEKVVNVHEHSIQKLGYCIYDHSAKIGDDIRKPNPWDDENMAKRAVEAFQRYANGEYPNFKAAWDSLEKA